MHGDTTTRYKPNTDTAKPVVPGSTLHRALTMIASSIAKHLHERAQAVNDSKSDDLIIEPLENEP